jgi:4-hydroxy-3-polyprenylbenzoate decarboxylase/2,5-furandicarboxylate decarboxylase 1
VGGVYNTRAKALIALESTEATVVERILRGLSKRIPPEVVELWAEVGDGMKG